ncbi:MAG TPA: hypothetical protein PKI20_00705 [Verrucomicrobiota bacterium]|nr:hypothetical protein [Verrucomicrobiota bacterium]HQL76618.1 hypothetical protein [Verrucomicrobiota bacterium]
MKNPNAVRPSAQELNESIRRPEDIQNLKMGIVMAEPKFDGSFVYVTRDRVTGETVFCTRDGNQLRLEPPIQNFLCHHFAPLTEYFLFEAELEPSPWTEADKAALNGNLYAGKAMPFCIRLVVHDVLPMDEIERPASTARERYGLLRSLAGVAEDAQVMRPHLWDRSERAGIYITPCQDLTLAQAADLFRQGWEAGKAQKRVMVGGLPYEGLVLINPESLHKGGRSHKWKVKPFHTVDIVVTELKEGHSGKVPLFEVHGYDTKTGEIVKITSGISPEMFAEMKRAEQQFAAVIVEAELSSLKDLKSANATLLGIRYDKMESLNQDAEPRPISLPSICCSKGGSSAISI